jgi:hypothetical protein
MEVKDISKDVSSAVMETATAPGQKEGELVKDLEEKGQTP